jgi:hypothetical protein
MMLKIGNRGYNMLKNYGFVWYARYYVSRWMILGGIAVMPAGRYRNDLIAMLWALSDHVHETIAVSNQESENL